MEKVILGHQENVLEQFIFLIFALIMDESLLVPAGPKEEPLIIYQKFNSDNLTLSTQNVVSCQN